MKEEYLKMSKHEEFRYRQVREFMSGKCSRKETAKLLQLSERSISRIATAIHEKGLKAVTHGNRGKVACNRIDEQTKQKVLNLVETKYYDFNMLHCLEVLKAKHKLKIARETFRRWCHTKQLVKRKKRRRAKSRFLRDRMPAEGYLLQMDGTPYRFNGRDVWHLIHAIDDATSEIPYGEFFLGETTVACMKVVQEIIRRKGIPKAIYTDRAGWSGGQKRAEFSQFKRACEELGIQVLFADSPEAKGRVERSFDTFQDRIVPELRVNKINTLKEANAYLRNHFLPNYWNKRNTVAPRQTQSEYRPLSKNVNLNEIFCTKIYRNVNRDHTFRFIGHTYTLKGPFLIPLVKKRIELRLYEDKPMGVFFENQALIYKLTTRYKKPEQSCDDYLDKLDQYLYPKRRIQRDTNHMRNLINLRKKEIDQKKKGTKSTGNYRDKIAGY